MARTDTLTNFLTDVANAIRSKKGTTNQISASNFDTEIASISTSASGNYTLQSKVVDPLTTTKTYTPDSGYYGLSYVQVNKVTASIDSNITSGNIKKGVSILGVTGTYESSSGSSGGVLPSGITKITSGTVTPTSDGNTLAVDHDLGEAPNFCLWEIVGTDFSTEVGSSLAVNGSTIVSELKNSSSSSMIYNLSCSIRGYNSSGALNGTVLGLQNTTYMTATKFTMVGNSTYKIKSGYTYRWICGVLEV